MSDSRPRHPNKEGERVIRELEGQGWTFRYNKHFVGYCPCERQHLYTISTTPSDPNHFKNKLRRALKLCQLYAEEESSKGAPK